MRPLIKFLLTSAMIFLSAKAGEDPLPYITVEMEDEIADAVRTFIRAPPYLIICEFVQAWVYPSEAFAIEAVFDFAEEGGRDLLRLMHKFIRILKGGERQVPISRWDQQ